MVVAATLDRYEEALWAQGFSRVAGCDEAGRGALAGPLVAAAVIIPPGFDPTGIRDSKLLTAKQRQAQFERITAACAVAVAKAQPPALDERGLHRSNIMLLRRAVRALEPDYALTDGFPVPRMPCPALSIKKGDMVSASVAAASIIAKVTRDRIMVRLSRRYPAFGFSHNKGYGTPDHWRALEVHGPTPVHRLSFHGVGQVALPGLSGAVFGVT
jgi:ribonuclease HII